MFFCQRSASSEGKEEEDFAPEMYLPVAQVPYPVATILLRTETSYPATMANSLRAELAHVDPNLPLTAVRVFDEYRADALAGARFNALLLSIFAGTALLLAAIGLYGVISYSVAQRTRELGIRIALGAQRGDVLKLVLQQSMALVAVGVLLGLAASIGLTRLMATILYGVSAADPITFVVLSTTLFSVALLACWLPARRASTVDPLVALRTE